MEELVSEIVREWAEYPIMRIFYCMLIFLFIFMIFHMLYWVFGISISDSFRAKLKYHKLKNKYNSKCIVAGCLHSRIDKFELDDCYIIATNKGLIFTPFELNLSIEISIFYDKINSFLFIYENAFSDFFLRQARRTTDFKIFLKDGRTLHFTLSRLPYDKAFNATSFRRVNLYKFLEKNIPLYNAHIEL